MPSLFETVVLTEEGHEHVPVTDVPFYLIAQESTFLVKPTQIGTVILPEYKKPTSIPKLGHAGGVFTWKGDKVPANIISQAHDFFLRIWQTKHSEAEVLITKHNDTGAFRLFVPYQRVSHMGVKSIYEPTHIDRAYTVVGTLHSHCDFTAFHSGTDSGDASDMDGVHFTIGLVNQPTPEIVAMVAMNGKEFHYKDVGLIADVEYATATAPPWWDTFVFTGDEAPRQKPASLISLTQEHWDEFLGRALVMPKPIHTAPPHVVRSPMFWGGDQRSLQFRDGKLESEDDWRARVYGGWKPKGTAPVPRPIATKEDATLLDIALDEAEKYGLLTEEDWDDCPDTNRDNVGYWQGFFLNKLEGARDVLETLGLNYTIGRPTRRAPQKGRRR